MKKPNNNRLFKKGKRKSKIQLKKKTNNSKNYKN